ncbi:hypothetical protein E2C01_092065 [Portunus trituberculatus]|uniref:Uncharacterized protein n=1 Tax=Portunus trituberculatus TaxID=210409 RepID=A0A5B7JUI0_PORTR|nr:hypothetical protein [Portunus trituberculatus]
MFTSKSDDKKKGDHSEASDAHSTTTTTATTIAAAPSNPAGPPAAAPPTETPKAAPPKSPLTVRDKLSKLRLSRSKEKKKQSDKGRSTSVDEASPRDGQDPRAALSLPTSPSRRPLTLFPSSFTKSSSPPQASGD